MNNTGIASFANDCVFTTPNPAQAKDSRVRNSIDGFPVIMYINDELEGIYTFNLDRYSTNSLGYDTKTFPKCLSYEISANTDTGAGAFVPWTTESGKTEREYIASDFRCRFPDNRANGDDDFAELKRLVDWVGNATDDMFREQIEEYFDLTYLIRYYLTVMCFGLVDNLAKNTMLTTFDGQRWYMQLYDCDSCTGLDNSGAMKFEPDIEVQVGIFNTSNSRLWTKLRNNFPNQILAEWETLRLSFFTEENIMKYLNEKISDRIPEINYNLDAWKKYITLGTEYLFACHGNRRQQITRWIRERLIYMDTLLGYTVSTNDYVTVRANKLGEVYFDIQTFQPMYFSIKFRNEENNTGIITKRVARGETVRFSYNLPVATDQEILVYGGRFIKDLGDLSNMNPTNLLLGNATRLTKVVCHDSDMLINASISNCTMLQEVDLRGCSNLGAGSDASLQTLDLTQCRNLRKVDIFGTQLTALYTSTVGGIIQEIVYPYSIQIVQVKNQTRLTSLGIPCYYTGNVGDTNNRYAEMLTLVDVANCPNVTSFVKNYYTNEDGSEVQVPTFIGVSKCRTFNISNTMSYLTRIDLSHCSNIESLTLDNFYDLKEINFDDISLWNATSSNLSNLTLTNCPNIETITFNQNTIDGDNSLGVAFKEGTTLDLSGLFNLKHIRSNVGIKGLKKLILPLAIQSLVFDYPKSTTYAYGESDIEDIFSKNALHETDGFKGIDLLDIETITDFSMGSLTKINNAINLKVKITDTFPYINYFKTDNYFKPEGIIDISEYKGSLEYLFKGIDLDKLTIVCNEPLPHTSAKYMFAYASGENVEILNTLFNYMPNATDFSYMFYCGYLKHAPLIPTRAENVSYMFYNNETMETTPSNWLQAYPITPISDYCYTGCSGIIMIDDAEGSIDVIPVAWGGFDRKNAVVNGETIIVEQTLEREFVNFTANGQTFQNIVPEVGQTPTLIANKSTQPVGEGMPTNILLADGLMPEAELEGFTLANLASEKRSSKMTCNQTENDIKAGLNNTFIVEDGGVVSQLELDGLTLVNIMPDTGKTPLISNNDGSYQINKGLDDGIILDTGKMLSSTLYGETMINLVNEGSNKTPLLTLDSTNPTNSIATIETELYEDYEKNIKIQDGGEIKSAILKGQMLVNLLDMNNLSQQDSTTYVIPLTTAKSEITIIATTKTANKSPRVSLYTEGGNWVKNADTSFTNNKIHYKAENGLYVKELVFTTNNIASDSYSYESLEQFRKQGFVVIEGNYEKDVPSYFEGMQSVKMPVLKTVGKNLFNRNGKLFDGWLHNGGSFIEVIGGGLWTTDFIETKNESYISFSGINSDFINFAFFDGYYNIVGSRINNVYTVQIPMNAKYIRITFNKSDTDTFQIEYGNKSTSYEPYKSNILSCNEEVTLYSIGDVCDTLDCKTGKLVQNIGEVVLDGSENWEKRDNTNSFWTYNGLDNLHCVNSQTTINCLCDMMESKTFKYAFDSTAIPNSNVGVVGCSGNKIAISFGSTTSKTLEQFKQELSLSPITVQYKLESPIVKTVDLKCVNQDDEPIHKCCIYIDENITISSDGLIPTLEYTLSTTNYFELNGLKSGVNYTLRFDGDATSGSLGNSIINAINDTLVATSATNNILYLEDEVSNVMLLEGNYTGRDIPYFTGMRSVEAIEVETIPSPDQPLFGKGGRK